MQAKKPFRDEVCSGSVRKLRTDPSPYLTAYRITKPRLAGRECNSGTVIS